MQFAGLESLDDVLGFQPLGVPRLDPPCEFVGEVLGLDDDAKVVGQVLGVQRLPIVLRVVTRCSGDLGRDDRLDIDRYLCAVDRRDHKIEDQAGDERDDDKGRDQSPSAPDDLAVLTKLHG